ncbi:hypothetical protein GN956_G2146 [Arapaima gigas]
MAELEVDQSHLPQVQEVCQCFSVLEDGALAHTLQEQEIEQYYNANVQKNQLVQNDIRVAKRLQDEEEQCIRQSRASRQLEEQDSEYARMIQQEIERHAEETRRREEEDEEIAKWLQQEEMDIRRQRHFSDDHSSAESSPLPEERPDASARPCLPLPIREESAGQRENERGICKGSPDYSQSRGPFTRSSRGLLHGHREIRTRGLRGDGSHSWPEGSEGAIDDKTVPSYTQSYRQEKTASHRDSYTRRIERDTEACKREDREASCRRHGVREDEWHFSTYYRENGEGGVDDHHRNCSRRRDCVRSWTYRERGTRERHVHFKDEGKRCSSFHGDNQTVSSKGHCEYFRDRREATRQSYHGNVRWASRDDYRYEECSARCQGQFLKRDQPTRCSYRGEFHKRGNNGESRGHRECTHSSKNCGYRQCHNKFTVKEDRVYQPGHSSSEYSDDDWLPNHRGEGWEMEGQDHGGRRRSNSRWRRMEGGGGRDGHGERRARRAKSMRWPSQPSSSEEEGGQRGDRQRRDRVQHSRSFSSSRATPRAKNRGAGSGPPGAALELGALQQVLLDEELARRLQEEEEELLAEVLWETLLMSCSLFCLPHGHAAHGTMLFQQSVSNPKKSYLEGDFRVAQVAQDEEIAHYIQHHERRSQEWSHPDLKEEQLRHERRDQGDSCERRSSLERKAPHALHGSLDSEGLNSPGEDCSPEHLPSSPVPLVQPVKNIAEVLDPTFKAKRQGSNPASQASSGNCQPSTSPYTTVYDYVQEPTFVPPTKRQSSKSGRPKVKDKKESCKQQ